MRAIRAMLLVFAVGSLGILGSCNGIQPISPQDEPITDPTQLYMSLTIDHPAVILSTVAGYDTLRLVATPRDALGQPMLGLPAATFKVPFTTDTAKVQVTPDGLVTARAAASVVTVVATLTVGPVTHDDTAHVKVTTAAPPPKLANISIDPIPPDSAVWAPIKTFLSGLYAFAGIKNTRQAPRAIDSSGSTIAASGMLYEYRSLDTVVAVFDRWTGVERIKNPGQARRVVRTTAYGIARADTVVYTVTLPAAYAVLMQNTGDLLFGASGGDLQRGIVRIAPYGMVQWVFQTTAASGDTVDITFDDPTHVAAMPTALCNVFLLSEYPSCGGAGNGIVVDNGDVSAETLYGLYGDGIMIRQFPVEGIYPYRSLRTGATGTVVVTTDYLGAD